MNASQSSCGAADMPSCSPRCLNTASPAALGRSIAWHLPRPRLLKQRGSLQIQPLDHHYISKSKHGGILAVRASYAGHSTAPLSLDNRILQQSDVPCQSENPSRKKTAIYALLCIALVVSCASLGQPGSAFASLTISSSSLGKEGTSPAPTNIFGPSTYVSSCDMWKLLPCHPLTSWLTGLRAAVRSAWAGLGAGFLHTLSGPDHLAVCPSPSLLLPTMVRHDDAMYHLCCPCRPIAI